MKVNKMAVLSALALAICASPALAAEHYTADQKLNYFFNKMDSNGDGVVNIVEHDAFANSNFRMADKNRDNVLTKKEMRNFKREMMRDMDYDMDLKRRTIPARDPYRDNYNYHRDLD